MAIENLDAERTPQQLLDDINTYISDAEALVEARDVLPLSGLDTVVEALCARILALAPDTGREYKPQLAALMQRLDALQVKMMAMKDEVASSIQTMNVQKKAKRAYAAADHTKPEA